LKDSLRPSLFILLLVVLVAGSSLFSQSWLSVAAEQVPYPPPEQTNNTLVGEPYPPPFLPSQPSAYPPPEEENIPLPTAQSSEDESYTPLLEIVAEIELRKSIGFRSDTEYVKAVRASDNMVIDERFGGVALTPAEARELEARLNLEKDGDALLDFFEKELEFQDAFGGIYLDHAAGSEDYTAGGKLVLQLVKTTRRQMTFLQYYHPSGIPNDCASSGLIFLVSGWNRNFGQFRTLLHSIPSSERWLLMEEIIRLRS